MHAFVSLSLAATAAGALDIRTKELMGLAISIAVPCEDCVAYHTRAALEAGASRQEVAETAALAVPMCGGPAAVYGPGALRAFDEYAAASGWPPLSPAAASLRFRRPG
jgi:AhpD family alkylhydroperoxidase